MISNMSMEQEQKNLQREVHSLEEKLARYPEGRLECRRFRKGHQWYFKDASGYHYIPKDQREKAEYFAMKTYLSRQLHAKENELDAISAYLAVREKASPRTPDRLMDSEGYRELLLPQLSGLEQELQDWMHADYERNTYPYENGGLVMEDGTVVRSKSEALIYQMLKQYHIPFRYECKIHLGEQSLCPDFMIRHPKTGEVFFWEHLGLMDDAGYVHRNAKKLQTYAKAGFLPGHNLILTAEKQGQTISLQDIDRIIRSMFLD